jgi:hypothetical protein
VALREDEDAGTLIVRQVSEVCSADEMKYFHLMLLVECVRTTWIVAAIPFLFGLLHSRFA